MLSYGSGTRPVQPESLPGFRANGDKTFRIACITQAHDFRCGQSDLFVVVADNVADQHHLRTAVVLGFTGIAHGFDIALVQVFETCQHHSRRAIFGQGRQIIANLQNGRHRFTNLSVEFQAEGARIRRHFMQNPARRGDNAIAAFFLYARQAAEKFVGNVLT